MEKKWTKTVMQAAICVGLLCLIWGGYFVVKEKLSHRIEIVLEDDFSWVVQVDEVRTEKEAFVIEGFAFELHKKAELGTFGLVLHNLDTNEFFFPKMEYLDREDVNAYFLCGYDYTRSGFVARIKEKKLDLEKNDYELLILPKWSHKPFRFGTYLSNGSLVYVNPKEFETLDVKGTVLEEIVENGTLRVYEPKNHMYVYQYKGDLYWIAEEEYGFVEGDTYVQYQLNTTQVARLPKDRLDSGLDWDNIEFKFSEYEIINEDTGKYRVAKKKIPTEYSIKKIWTGNHIDNWVWISEFRPRYEFKIN